MAPFSDASSASIFTNFCPIELKKFWEDKNIFVVQKKIFFEVSVKISGFKNLKLKYFLFAANKKYLRHICMIEDESYGWEIEIEVE